MIEKRLPNSWCEATIKEINFKKSQNIDPSKFPDNRFELYSVPIYETGKPEIIAGREIGSTKQVVSENEVLICKINPRINRVWEVGNFTKNQKIASSEWIVVNTGNYIDTTFARYLFSAPFFRLMLQSEVSGVGGSLTRARPKLVENYAFPLPPLAEQQRIVAKLDNLYTRFEKMKNSLNRIPQLLKDFRQAVLTQALTGKLTAEWREENHIQGTEREVKLISLLKEKPRNGYSPKGVEYHTNVKSLNLGATTTGKFDSTKIKYLDIDVPPEDSYLWLKYGDILIQRSNSIDYVGVSAIYDGRNNDFIYPDIMMKLRLKDSELIKYVFYQLSSIKLRSYFRENATGTAGNMPKINQRVVSESPIILRSKEEQQEIVRRVEFLFAKADKIEAQYQIVKEKVEQLPQAILAKAFRGELVEQLPSDGDARELLEQIKQARAELDKKPKTTTKRGNTRKLKQERLEKMVAEPKASYKKP